MKGHQWLVCIAFLLTAGSTFAGDPGCGLPEIGAREMHHLLSLRAVEVIKRVARPDESSRRWSLHLRASASVRVTRADRWELE